MGENPHDDFSYTSLKQPPLAPDLILMNLFSSPTFFYPQSKNLRDESQNLLPKIVLMNLRDEFRDEVREEVS